MLLSSYRSSCAGDDCSIIACDRVPKKRKGSSGKWMFVPGHMSSVSCARMNYSRLISMRHRSEEMANERMIRPTM